MTCKKAKKWHSLALAEPALVFARSGETKMRRQFLIQCSINGVMTMLFGGVVLVLYWIQPPVASPIPMPPTTFEELFQKHVEGVRGTPIPSRPVQTIRILNPDEPP